MENVYGASIPPYPFTLLGNVLALGDIRTGAHPSERSSHSDKLGRRTEHQQRFRQTWQSRCAKHPTEGPNEVHRGYQGHYIPLQPPVSPDARFNCICHGATGSWYSRSSSSHRINSLDELLNMGLYLNDLNPHGMSRELVLAGWQHCGRYRSLRVTGSSRIILSEIQIFIWNLHVTRRTLSLSYLATPHISCEYRSQSSCASCSQQIQQIQPIFCVFVEVHLLSRDHSSSRKSDLHDFPCTQLMSFVRRLEMMFERAEQRSTELENSYALLDRWKNKSDELLYSMIPQTVADRLRAGASPLSTCEVREQPRKIPSHLPVTGKYTIVFAVVRVDHRSLLRTMWLRLLDHRGCDGHRLVHERGFLLLRHADGSV